MVCGLRAQVEAVAGVAARMALEVHTIFHSGKLRARQTAEIFGISLAPPGQVREHAGLAPNDDPALAARLVDEVSGALLLVGHLPHLNRLASLLLVGDPTREIVAFRMGAMVQLSRDAAGWRVRWILTPEIVGPE